MISISKVIKYGDVSKVETEFKPAPVGLYHGKVESVEQKQSKNNDEPMVEVVFQLTKDANGKKLKERYGQLWYYAPLDPDASWARRMKDLITAFGLKPKGGNLAVIEGKEALLRLREDTDLNGDYRPNIGKIMKVKDADVDEDVEDDEDEDEETSNGLTSLSRAELKKLIKDEELDITVKKSMSDDDLRAAIEEQMEDEDDEDDEDLEDEEDDEEEDDTEAEEDNYEEMSLSALRQELKDRELETKGKKPVLIARLRTDDVEEPV